jgi:phosphoserine aminotransferase
MMPLEVLEEARDELTDWRGSGTSVLEVSHRGKAFTSVALEAEIRLRELLAIPRQYRVLFLQGGASGQFAAIPLNLTRTESTVDYLNRGLSKKAIGEAQRFAHVHVAADEAASHYTTVPAAASVHVSPQAAYLHYTANETIGGVEFPTSPTGPGPAHRRHVLQHPRARYRWSASD